VKTYWPNLSYFFLFPFFLLVSIALTVINPYSAIVINLRVGQINPGTFGVALTTQCSELSEAFMPFSGYASDTLTASLSSLLSFGSFKSPFQLRQFSGSGMHSIALSSSRLAGWWSIHFIWWTFNSSVCPPGSSFADKAGGKDELSKNLYAAASTSC